jgi:hypothetical protein
VPAGEADPYRTPAEREADDDDNDGGELGEIPVEAEHDAGYSPS